MVVAESVVSSYTVRAAVIVVFGFVGAAMSVGLVPGLLVGIIATSMLNV
jgi:hypothetical protein